MGIVVRYLNMLTKRLDNGQSANEVGGPTPYSQFPTPKTDSRRAQSNR
jgi:hypothetical protein